MELHLSFADFTSLVSARKKRRERFLRLPSWPGLRCLVLIIIPPIESTKRARVHAGEWTVSKTGRHLEPMQGVQTVDGLPTSHPHAVARKAYGKAQDCQPEPPSLGPGWRLDRRCSKCAPPRRESPVGHERTIALLRSSARANCLRCRGRRSSTDRSRAYARSCAARLQNAPLSLSILRAPLGCPVPRNTGSMPHGRTPAFLGDRASGELHCSRRRRAPEAL